MLTPQQIETYQPWSDNGRRLRDLADQLERPSLEAMRTAERWKRYIGLKALREVRKPSQEGAPLCPSRLCRNTKTSSQRSFFISLPVTTANTHLRNQGQRVANLASTHYVAFGRDLGHAIDYAECLKRALSDAGWLVTMEGFLQNIGRWRNF